MKKSILIAVLSIASINGYSAPPKHLNLPIEAPDALKGILAGMYVQSFAGANTHTYVITFKAGKYSGYYEEFENGTKTKVTLQNVVVNETDKTISFKQGKDDMKGKLTNDGLDFDGDVYTKI